MKLTSEDAVRDALQIESISLIDTSLTSALHNATEELGAAILADFAEGSHTDVFFIHAMMRVGSGYRATLALAHGFLSGAPSCTYGGTYQTREDTELEDTEFRADLTKGAVVIDSQTDYTGSYVAVSYDAGFPVDGSDAELFAEASVPEWLRRAATLIAMGGVVQANPDLAGSPGANARDWKELKASGVRVAEAHTRYFPTSIRPL